MRGLKAVPTYVPPKPSISTTFTALQRKGHYFVFNNHSSEQLTISYGQASHKKEWEPKTQVSPSNTIMEIEMRSHKPVRVIVMKDNSSGVKKEFVVVRDLPKVGFCFFLGLW
jgi:hypothetical protein